MKLAATCECFVGSAKSLPFSAVHSALKGSIIMRKFASANWSFDKSLGECVSGDEWNDKYRIRSRIKLVERILSKMPWLLMRSILTCLLSFCEDTLSGDLVYVLNLSCWFLLNATSRNMFCSYKTMPRRYFNRHGWSTQYSNYALLRETDDP